MRQGDQRICAVSSRARPHRSLRPRCVLWLSATVQFTLDCGWLAAVSSSPRRRCCDCLKSAAAASLHHDGAHGSASLFHASASNGRGRPTRQAGRLAREASPGGCCRRCANSATAAACLIATACAHRSCDKCQGGCHGAGGVLCGEGYTRLPLWFRSRQTVNLQQSRRRGADTCMAWKHMLCAARVSSG